jgi:hypothetical protein
MLSMWQNKGGETAKMRFLQGCIVLQQRMSNEKLEGRIGAQASMQK